MRIEGSAPSREGAGAPGDSDFQSLLDKLSRQDWLSDCLALQTNLRAAEHARLRGAARDRRRALHEAERALRAAREEAQRFRDLAKASDGVGLTHGVLAGLVSSICWWAGLIHGIAYAAHIGQATYCRDREAAAQRDQVRQQAARTEASQRAQALLMDMQQPMEIERRMRARLVALVELEQQVRLSALRAPGGDHARGAGG